MKLYAANWKMHKNIEDAAAFVDEFLQLMKSLGSNDNNEKEIVICPPFIALDSVGRKLNGSRVLLGAQNMHFEDAGAFTGEISPLMLKSVGCSYVILGHSERRLLFKEDNALINKKVKAALRHGIKPILCVGESLEQREEALTKRVLSEQLSSCLEGVSDTGFVVAYEPVWAIGTGRSATPEQIREAHSFIRGFLEEKFGDPAGSIRILYGGSVSPDNIKDIIGIDNVNGCLVGTASLNAKSFFDIAYPKS